MSEVSSCCHLHSSKWVERSKLAQAHPELDFWRDGHGGNDEDINDQWMLMMRFHRFIYRFLPGVIFLYKLKLGIIFIQLHLRFRAKEIWICIVCGTVQCSVILWDLSDIFPIADLFQVSCWSRGISCAWHDLCMIWWNFEIPCWSFCRAAGFAGKQLFLGLK